MPLKYYTNFLQLTLSFLVLCCFATPLSAQFTEDFEDEVVGSNTFIGGGVAFSTTDPLDVGSFMDGGSNGAGDDQFLEANGTGTVGQIVMLTAGRAFQLHGVDVWLSADAGLTTSAGTVTFRGTLAAGGTVDVDFNTMPPDGNSWLPFAFAETALAGVDLTELTLIIDADKNYLALDDFSFIATDPNAVNVTVADATQIEGDDGTTFLNFTVTRSNNNTTFSMDAATADITAQGGSDYATVNTTFDFIAGNALTQTVSISIRGDREVEFDETFALNLSNPTNGAQIVDGQGIGTIIDDDASCETFEDEMPGNQSFMEMGVSFSTSGALAVAFASSTGSDGSDFYLDTGAGNGGSAGSVGEIAITTADKVFELLEVDLWPSADDGTSRAGGEVTFTGTKPDLTTVSHTFTLGVSGTFNWEERVSFVGTTLDGVVLTKVEISLGTGLNYLALDDLKFAEFDENQVLVNISDVSQAEGDAGTSEFVFAVTRSNNNTAFMVTAASAVAGVSPATVGLDYQALDPLVLSFAAGGELSKNVTVLVNGDTDAELSETFIVGLSVANNGTEIADGQGLGTILDDDTICETFEDEAAPDLTVFSEAGTAFSANGNLQTGFFASGGSTGSDYYLESDADGAPYMTGSSVGSIAITTAETGFELLRLDLWLSNDNDINTAEVDQLRFIGTPEDGSPAVTVDITSTNAGNWSENISFAGTAFENLVLASVEVVLQGGSNYVALDNICFEAVPICDPVTFIALADLCIDAGVQAGLGGGMPAGGVYSGPGVTDDGNGMSYSFDPAAAGAGMQTITYTYADERGCSGTATDVVEVFALPEVTFTPSVTMVDANAGIQTGITGGLPVGGVYSGTGVTDDGNGQTFSFDPSGFLPGSTTFIRYTFTDANGCTNFVQNVILINELMLPADECTDAADISGLTGQPYLEPQTSGVWDNTNYTSSAADPDTGWECFGEPDGGGSAPSLERTIWYSFTGDGNMYRIRTVFCAAADPENYAADTQIALYRGECDGLIPLACNEDESFPDTLFNADITIMTEAGTTYSFLVDGFGPDFASFGEYCVEVTNLTSVNTVDITESALTLYPNPTSGRVQLANESVDRVEVFDVQGRQLATYRPLSQSLDLTLLPSGLYLLRLHTPAGVVRAKVVRE